MSKLKDFESVVCTRIEETIVLFPVLDGHVIYERVEGHFRYSRFPVTRLPLPHLLQLLEPECLEAWERGEPLQREEEMRKCWGDGWEMYFAHV